MNINLITPPDKIYNDSVSVLLVFPNKDIQSQIQQEVFPIVQDSLNVYLYDKPQYTLSDIDWLLSTFSMADIVILDIDNCPPHIRDLAGFMIAKSKTYWLTNAVDTVYTQISRNRIYNISFLSAALGGISEEDKTN